MHQHKIIADGDDDVPRGPAVLHAATRSTACANQVDFLRKAGAISLQCTVHIPAVGTREYEKTLRQRSRCSSAVGSYKIPQSKIDGNHVLVAGEEPAWKRQLKLLGGYATFYNPLNVVRALKNDGSKLRKRRFGWQVAGLFATAWTALKVLPYAVRLMTGKQLCHKAAPPVQTVPVRSPRQATRVPRRSGAGRNRVGRLGRLMISRAGGGRNTFARPPIL